MKLPLSPKGGAAKQKGWLNDDEAPTKRDEDAQAKQSNTHTHTQWAPGETCRGAD